MSGPIGMRVNLEVEGENALALEEQARAELALLDPDAVWSLTMHIEPIKTVDGTVRMWKAEVDAHNLTDRRAP